MRPSVPSGWWGVGADSVFVGHVSVQTTERCLGCKQRFRNAVNDRIGMEPGTLEPQ